MTPYGVLASSASARRCSPLRLGSRGDATMRPEVPESLTGDCRVADKEPQNRSERKWGETLMNSRRGGRWDDIGRHETPRPRSEFRLRGGRCVCRRSILTCYTSWYPT